MAIALSRLAFLLVHGLLHLAGYEHDEEEYTGIMHDNAKSYGSRLGRLS